MSEIIDKKTLFSCFSWRISSNNIAIFYSGIRLQVLYNNQCFSAIFCYILGFTTFWLANILDPRSIKGLSPPPPGVIHNSFQIHRFVNYLFGFSSSDADRRDYMLVSISLL